MARLKSYNKRRSLGTEWPMTEVGIPSPRNSDNHPALVESINNNNNNNNYKSRGVFDACYRMR